MDTGNSDDRVTIYLAIESVEITPSSLTERLGMRPDRHWVIGEARGKTGKFWDCHGWVVETTVRSDDNDGRPASQLIPIAMERFQKRVEPMAPAVSALRGSAQVYVVLTTLAEEVPGIECGHSFLELVARLGGSFQ